MIKEQIVYVAEESYENMKSEVSYNTETRYLQLKSWIDGMNVVNTGMTLPSDIVLYQLVSGLSDIKYKVAEDVRQFNEKYEENNK